MPYLGNIPEIGELTEEKILFEFDKIPIIFVCHNQTRKKYLCVCTDCIVGYSWLLTEITRTTLIELIKDKISVLKAFEISKIKFIVLIEKKINIRMRNIILQIFRRKNFRMQRKSWKIHF